MPEFVYATLEPGFHNSDGCVVTLYFGGEPTLAQVCTVCENELEHLNLGVDTNDEFFAFEEHSTPVSERAGLRRYEVYPTC